jgi:gamma-glutamyl hercynylcysteine S-oxide synthase
VNHVADIRSALVEAREHTLGLFRDVNEEDFRRQLHPDFSPLGWHLGHIGVAESFWILQQCKKEPPLSRSYDLFFTPTDNPKPNRVNLPSRPEILAYLEYVRVRVLSFLDEVDLTADHPLLKDGGIFQMLLQHEAQHNETILLIRQLLAADKYRQHSAEKKPTAPAYAPAFPNESNPQREMALVPAGAFLMGSNDATKTLDNERPSHEVAVATFAIDQLPVSNGDFLRFVEAGGYHTPALWRAEGWQWRIRYEVESPLYWRQLPDKDWLEVRQTGVHPLHRQQPVRSVSCYEADAYARFVGKRLPTEAEWERAAVLGVLQGLGSVWEWTSTWFAPYPGFTAHPYEGYSVPYFDDQHRVLRGGSWATRPQIRRITFRNWYHPWVREIFAGVRCAQDA